MTAKLKCSNQPQQIKAHGKWAQWWYYEYPGSIEVIVDADTVRAANGKVVTFHIPARLLRASLERINNSRRTR